jgi:hypothetical protein
MCLSILESLMATTHGAEEPGLCPHGLAYQAGAWGRYIGFCFGFGHIWPKSKVIGPAKIFWEAHNFGPSDFDKRIFASKAWDAGDVDRGIARVNHATRARAIGTCLRTHFGTVYL